MRAAMAILAGASMLAAPAFGETGVNLHYGERGNIKQYAASARFGELWAREGSSWTMRLQPVVEGGHFRYSGSRPGNDNLSYGSVGLGFRVAGAGKSMSPYFEAGLGGALFSKTSLADRSFSTKFQFTEWVGVGLDFGERFSIGWRYAHFSNAGIKKPNDGIDVQQLVLGARF